MEWLKVASVTTGGKQYFYNTFTPSGKRTVVWDRNLGKWLALSDQQPPKGDCIFYGAFDKVDDAKWIIETFYNK